MLETWWGVTGISSSLSEELEEEDEEEACFKGRRAGRVSGLAPRVCVDLMSTTELAELVTLSKDRRLCLGSSLGMSTWTPK